MPRLLHDFLARATQKASADLEAALSRLPSGRRGWSPMGEACAHRAGHADFNWAAFGRAKAALAQNGHALLSLLHANTQMVIAAIHAVAEKDLNVPVPMPWGPMALSEVMAYPYWNMSYHEGQILSLIHI